MNDKLESDWKESLYPRIWLDWENDEKSQEGRCHNKDSKPAPSDYK
jgi:hypothetical protein